MRGLRWAIGAAILCLTCAGCGSGDGGSLTTSTRNANIIHLSPATRENNCVIYASGSADEISFDSDQWQVEPECQAVTTAFARAGMLWVPNIQQTDMSSPTQICDLTDPGSDVEAIAESDSADIDHQAAQSACDSLLAAGWVNASTTGQGTTTP
jgi:hypothetical protein